MAVYSYTPNGPSTTQGDPARLSFLIADLQAEMPVTGPLMPSSGDKCYAKDVKKWFTWDGSAWTQDGGAAAAVWGLITGTLSAQTVPAPLAEDLIRCQRRFCKSFPLTVVPAASVSEASGGSGVDGIIGKAGATALAAQIAIQFPVQMWKTPTVTYFTPTAAGAQAFRLSGTTPAAQTATASRASSTTDRGVVCTATGDANGAVGDLVGVHYTADAEIVA